MSERILIRDQIITKTGSSQESVQNILDCWDFFLRDRNRHHKPRIPLAANDIFFRFQLSQRVVNAMIFNENI